MSEIKPVAYFIGALNAFTTSQAEAEKEAKKYPVDALYPAAALEALQEENAKLKEALRLSCDEGRSQLWEASASCGGCERAIDAEAKCKSIQDNTKLIDDMLSKVIEDRNNAEQSMCKLRKDNAAQAKRIVGLEVTNKQLGDYYMKVNEMYWNDTIFEWDHGNPIYTDEFVEMVNKL